MSGDVTYNGYPLRDFIPQTVAGFVDQTDNHSAELSVREVLDFAARCQGATHGEPVQGTVAEFPHIGCIGCLVVPGPQQQLLTPWMVPRLGGCI